MSLFAWLIEILIVTIFVHLGIVQYRFDEEGITSKLALPPGPKGFLKVHFDYEATLLGNEFAPVDVSSQPAVCWDGSKRNSWYTIIFEDIDTKFGSYLHWMVGNNLGACLSNGEVLALFFPSAPRNGTGLHRYVFLWYEQPGKLDFSEFPQIPQFQTKGRLGFNTTDFVQKYNLSLRAGNFYKAQWDSSVDAWISKLIF